MEVIGIAALSLDGCITRHDEEGSAFASEEDQRYFHAALRGFDCSLLGSRTFEASRPAILRSLSSDRLRIVRTRDPGRFAGCEKRDCLEFKSGGPREIMLELAGRGRSRCAVLGGASVYTACLSEGVLQELWLTLEPLAFGRGKRLFEGTLDARFSLLSVEPLSPDTLLLKYRTLPA